MDEVGRTPAADLSDEEAREIRLIYGQNPARIGVERDVVARSWVLEGKGHVGAVTLSTGRTIRIRTKVPVRSILYMLGFGRAGYDFFDPTSAYAQLDDFFEIIVAEFADRAAALLRTGLHQGYMEDEDDSLTAVRGRIQVLRQLRKNFVQRERFACRYADLTMDLPLNRALRLATYLARHSVRDAAIQKRLDRNLRLFGGVSLTSMESGDVLRIPLDRLTERYRVPLVLAALIIGSVTLEDAIGGLTFSSYLVDMNVLFQQFIAAVLSSAVHGRNLRVVANERRYLDLSKRLEFTTDVEIWSGSQCLVVIDTKYKRYEGTPDPGDRYQVIAYDLKLSPQHVVLLYPEDKSDYFRIDSVELRILGLDLSLPPEELRKQATRLADELLAPVMAGGSERAS